MTKAVLTLSPGSIYDDSPECQYHFPKTYLKQVEGAVGDWIVYYEPRRNAGISSSGGRQSYFAVAMVDRVRKDPASPDHYYADISNFLSFDAVVPFKSDGYYYEKLLQRDDGQTNKGAFGRAVRQLSDHEYQQIVKAGFRRELADWEVADNQSLILEERPITEQLVRRKFRDVMFRRQVREAYSNTCAVTGFNLINGGGRPEVEAAHIIPVEKHGPDSIRNGIALTGTVHWMFDRGLISLDDDYRLLVAGGKLSGSVQEILQEGRQIKLPKVSSDLPHPAFLSWHRQYVFHG